MEETLRQQLIDLADAYASASGCSLQAIGREVMRDGSFFRRMRAGDGFTVKTFDRVIVWFFANWPLGLDWPESIPRPETTIDATPPGVAA